MTKNKKNIILTILIAFAVIMLASTKVYAAPQGNNNITIPKVNISLDNTNTPQGYVDDLKMLIGLTVLALLPSIVVMMTSFTRIIVVFGFLRNAMNTQQSPPNQVLVGLALFLTFFIMFPTASTINKNAVQPYLNNKITQEQALVEGEKPIREFMYNVTRQKDLKLFIDASKIDTKNLTKDNIPMHIVVPAFIISELKTAFEIGFLLYIPFVIIDIVVSSILMSMGMFMLPPTMISLPFKLLLFIMADGWHLLVQSLIQSYMR